MQHSTAPSQFIPYTFTYATTGNGAGKSSPITLNIASTVANTDFINAQAGNYTDTVTLTIMP
jgi:spore coat protein U-like protein